MRIIRKPKNVIIYHYNNRPVRYTLNGIRIKPKYVAKTLLVLHSICTESECWWEQSAPGQTELHIRFSVRESHCYHPQGK